MTILTLHRRRQHIGRSIAVVSGNWLDTWQLYGMLQVTFLQNVLHAAHMLWLQALRTYTQNTVLCSAHPSGEMGAIGRSENHCMISSLVQLNGSPRSFSMPA